MSKFYWWSLVWSRKSKTEDFSPLIPHLSHMGFVGSNYSGKSIGGHHCSYDLGVLVPVAGGNLYLICLESFKIWVFLFTIWLLWKCGISLLICSFGYVLFGGWWVVECVVVYCWVADEMCESLTVWLMRKLRYCLL